MFDNIKRKIKLYKMLHDNKAEEDSLSEKKVKLTKSLIDNLVTIREKMNNSSDLVIREIEIGGVRVSFVLIEGMTDLQSITQLLIHPLNNKKFGHVNTNEEIYDFIENKLVVGTNVMDVYDTDELFLMIMSGFVVVLIDGIEKGISIGVQGYAYRSITEPSSEVNLRSSKEGFVEAIRVNLSMIRRRMKTPQLRFEMMQAGTKSRTDICLVYLDGVAPLKTLDSVRHKISQVKLHSVLESGYLEGFLKSKPYAIFSDVGTTEKPDTLLGKIAEGRVAVLVDGTPFALIVPYLFLENFQYFDDYSNLYFFTIFNRVLRCIAFFLSLLLPGLYVAISTFHPEIFPYEMVYNIVSSQIVTPFPLWLEALIIHIIFELMREAGYRMPQQIANAVSIVGALVIGQAAVNAGIIGAPMLIIVALTSISAFVLPTLYPVSAFLRFIFIILGGFYGLYGIVLGLIFIVINITSIENQGIPYTAPASPFTKKAMGDFIMRQSWTKKQYNELKLSDLKGAQTNYVGNSGGQDE